MKKFIINFFYFSIPLLVWAILIVIIDPFNYFNLVDLKNKSPKHNAEKLNTLLFRTIDFKNDPTNNILIGDSRTDALPIELIENYEKSKYKKLNTNAAKINEIFELFYYANDIKKIDKVVIGINFSMFNKYSYQNRVENTLKIINNPLIYIFNKTTIEASFYVIRSRLFKINLNTKPKMSKEEFWKWIIKTKSKHWYAKYKYPENLYKKLKEFDLFTKNNNTEVIFIVVPHHREFHQKLIDYGLEIQEIKFKETLSSLNAKVYDFDYFNAIIANKNNFKDPIHYNDSIGKLIVNEIWGNKLLIGKKL